MTKRYDILHEIEQLNPEKDHQHIVYLVGSYEYPWLIRKSLEFALFRTYAVPRMTAILKATGQFNNHGQKRYDDTTLMLAGIAEHGYDSDYGTAAIAIMNRLHGRYHIKNEDFLYVLSTFIYEPIRWHQKYGWRTPTHNEKLANYYFWREVGQRMNIQNIPESLEAYEQFNLDYEREQFRYADSNHVIGMATIDIFLKWYPAPLRPVITQFIYAMMDDPLREAFGFPKPHSIYNKVADFGLKLAARVLRHMPPRKTPFMLTQAPNRTYPDGFNISEIGAKH